MQAVLLGIYSLGVRDAAHAGLCLIKSVDFGAVTCVEFRDIAVRMVWRTDRGACRRPVPPLISNRDAMVLVDPSINKKCVSRVSGSRSTTGVTESALFWLKTF